MDLQLSEAIFKLTRCIKSELTFDSKTANLTILQIRALFFINKHEKTSMKNIAENFRIEMPTASSLINKLHTLELVERKTDTKDRRIIRLALTSQGQTLLKQAMQQHNQKITKLLAYLPDTDKKELLRIINIILEKLNEENEK